MYNFAVFLLITEDLDYSCHLSLGKISWPTSYHTLSLVRSQNYNIIPLYSHKKQEIIEIIMKYVKLTERSDNIIFSFTINKFVDERCV